MERKYSVFTDHVGTFCDRYCNAYSEKSYTISEKFDRIKSIPLISAVDLNMTKDYADNKDEVKESLKRTGLKVNSVMMDSTADRIFRQGSFSSLDFAVRKRAVEDAKKAMDFAEELGCSTFAVWPGQDGYDYMFEADYIKERTLFVDCLKELSAYKPNMNIALEYKPKEPRNKSYIDTMTGTLLMIEKSGLDNLGIAMDYGHSFFSGENPAEAVAILSMYGGKLMAIHMNDNYGSWDDDMIAGSVNTLPYLEFIYWLRRTGYNGYITFDQFPYREESRDAVNESALWFDYLESLIDNADMDEIAETLTKKDGVSASRLMRKLIMK
ncbi:MAG: TIM barrel protein [Clostridia bacterium]|nr:TIM barrel protein [Clostridia bacterium]